jgi:hypothetical protein
MRQRAARLLPFNVETPGGMAKGAIDTFAGALRKEEGSDD